MNTSDSLSFAPDFARAIEFFQAQDNYAVSALTELEGPGGMTVFAGEMQSSRSMHVFCIHVASKVDQPSDHVPMSISAGLVKSSEIIPTCSYVYLLSSV